MKLFVPGVLALAFLTAFSPADAKSAIAKHAPQHKTNVHLVQHSRLRGTHLHKTEDDGTDGDVGIILIEDATPPPTAETDPGCDIESGCAERTNAPRHAKMATRQIEDDEDMEDDILATHLEIEDDVTGDTAHAVVLEDQKIGESTVLLEDEETGDVVVIDGSSRHHKQKRAVAAGGRRSKH